MAKVKYDDIKDLKTRVDFIEDVLQDKNTLLESKLAMIDEKVKMMYEMISLLRQNMDMMKSNQHQSAVVLHTQQHTKPEQPIATHVEVPTVTAPSTNKNDRTRSIL